MTGNLSVLFLQFFAISIERTRPKVQKLFHKFFSKNFIFQDNIVDHFNCDNHVGGCHGNNSDDDDDDLGQQIDYVVKIRSFLEEKRTAIVISAILIFIFIFFFNVFT